VIGIISLTIGKLVDGDGELVQTFFEKNKITSSNTSLKSILEKTMSSLLDENFGST